MPNAETIDMKQNVFLLLLGAILIPAALNAQNDWANYERYAAENAKVAKAPKAVLMGDSITDGWPAADMAFFNDNNFVGRGISGQVTSQMLLRFRQDVVDLDPKYVVILAGTNDIAGNSGKIDMDKTFGNIVSMCEIAKSNKIRPVICSVLPATRFGWSPMVTDAAEKIILLNSMLKEYARKNRIRYVDYHTAMKNAESGLSENLAYDGVHPTAEGYEIMENLLLKVLR